MTEAMEVMQVEIAKLSLKPGDILVLRLKGNMSREKRDKASRFLGHLDMHKHGVKVAILTDDAEFQIVEAPPKA